MQPREHDAQEVDNNPAEGLNSRVKMIKVRSRGFRNRSGLPMQSISILGGLNLYPEEGGGWAILTLSIGGRAVSFTLAFKL
ncbi:transposase [Candidatus Vondammii sp. HM_W22]|uniref:transposase n=1 Tax=Candidatus Vondammii sp. HM_W22 TaxID=2687299 RepID=UPI00403DD840